MAQRLLIRPNAYRDSVTLMALTQKISELPGVTSCVVAMATEMNKELPRGGGRRRRGPAAAGETSGGGGGGGGPAPPAHAALAAAEAALQAPAAPSGGGAAAAPRSLSTALAAAPGANLALISTPGAYAAREARQALERGLHVLLYSDNVPLAEEVALKQLAHEQGLLLMGPDCGTAIIDGIGLGFANVVRPGPIGIVAASGTGAQELSTLIDRLGSGVSQLIGVGGRDLNEAVGGRMTLDAIARLADDPDTAVIAVVAKPPAAAVAAAVMQALQGTGKPLVPCFLGTPGGDLDAAAARAVSTVTGRPAADLLQHLGYDRPLQPLPYGQGRRRLRGLFAGGTLCEQAHGLLVAVLGSLGEHTLIDLGDDEFTLGRPHPMIDSALRREKLRQAAADPETAVILLDVVLGHGAHADPVGSLAPAIRAAVQQGIAVVASVTGTEADPQRLSAQVAKLGEAGAFVAPTARRAALAAAATLKGGMIP